MELFDVITLQLKYKFKRYGPTIVAHYLPCHLKMIMGCCEQLISVNNYSATILQLEI
jgi:hypothetical protein